MPLDTPTALAMVVQQVFIGVTIGFAAKVVFTAIEFAGEVIGPQMGLNFATFFDPTTSGRAPCRRGCSTPWPPGSSW